MPRRSGRPRFAREAADRCDVALRQGRSPRAAPVVLSFLFRYCCGGDMPRALLRAGGSVAAAALAGGAEVP